VYGNLALLVDQARLTALMWPAASNRFSLRITQALIDYDFRQAYWHRKLKEQTI